MKFKNGSKRFLTLNPNNSEGFTLVELIVVIAILAILAGVAVPAYNGYIEKANKQADISLISEIEHALTLAYYDQKLPEGDAGFVLLLPNTPVSLLGDTSSAGYEYIVPAMENTFGANWAETLQLKYDGWGVDDLSMIYEDATAVVTSNFVQNYSPEELMSEVQAMTSAVNGITQQQSFVSVWDMFSYGEDDNVINDVREEYGITKEWDKMNSTERSNLLVLATASSISNGDVTTRAESPISSFAVLTAYASVDDSFNEEYQEFQNKINNLDAESEESQFEQIKAAYKELESAASSNSGYQNWLKTNQDNHLSAFNAIMAGVGNAMKDNGDAIIAELGNSNMFTTGIGNELYNEYLNKAYATAALGEGINEILAVVQNQAEGYEGSVVVMYVVVDGSLLLSNSMA